MRERGRNDGWTIWDSKLLFLFFRAALLCKIFFLTSLYLLSFSLASKFHSLSRKSLRDGRGRVVKHLPPSPVAKLKTKQSRSSSPTSTLFPSLPCKNVRLARKRSFETLPFLSLVCIPQLIKLFLSSRPNPSNPTAKTEPFVPTVPSLPSSPSCPVLTFPRSALLFFPFYSESSKSSSISRTIHP